MTNIIHKLDAQPAMHTGIEIDREHKRRVRDYVNAAQSALDALVSVVAFETAVREAGLGINSPLYASQFRAPLGLGLALTMHTEAPALAAAVTQAHADLFTTPANI